MLTVHAYKWLTTIQWSYEKDKCSGSLKKMYFEFIESEILKHEYLKQIQSGSAKHKIDNYTNNTCNQSKP
jgi:hypothetical protein